MKVKTALALLLGALSLHPQTPAQPAAVDLFQVTAGGQAVTLHEFGGGAFGLFEFAKPVEVEIRAAFAIRWADIRPLSAGITPIISPDHSSLRFRLDRVVPLTVEFNGEIKRVIHLFAYGPEKDAPKPGDPNVIYFGPGMHNPGIIEAMEGETIYLAPGAWVKGMVRSYGTKNVTIRGRGVLDAGSLPPHGDPALQARGRLGTPPPAGYGGGGRNVIYLEKTEQARVEGITLFNSPQWTLYLKNATGTHIDGVRILSWSAGCTTDGIDIVSSSNTVVENVFVRSNDDCVAVKNMDNVDQSNITVRNSVFWNMPCGNGIEIGFETRSAKTEKVRFDNIDIIHVERGAAISIHHGDNAVIQDIIFSDIRVEDARHKLIDFAILFGGYGTDRPTPDQRKTWRDVGGAWDAVLNVPPAERAERAKYRGVIRDVHVNNLHVVGGGLPFSIISGFNKDRPIENVTIENMRYLGRPIRSAAEGKFSVSDAVRLAFK
jgi:hypothetical protein